MRAKFKLAGVEAIPLLFHKVRLKNKMERAGGNYLQRRRASLQFDTRISEYCCKVGRDGGFCWVATWNSEPGAIQKAD
jgi:hypothetical protein